MKSSWGGSEMDEAGEAQGRILVVERTQVAAAALAALIRQVSGLRPAALSADNGRSDVVVRAASRQRVAIVLVGDRAGQPLEALGKALGRQGSRLVAIVEPHSSAQELRMLAAAGVTLLSSAADACELGRALRCVAAGRGFVSADVSLSLESGHPAPGGRGWPALSAREHTVARLLSEGADRQAISALLALSPKTVSTYRGRIMRKLCIANEVQLARLFDAKRGSAQSAAPR